MKAIIYARVSTAGQCEDGVSLENQKVRAEAWCVANGYEPAAIFVEAMSGGKATNRPELQKALAMVCKLRGVLVVYSLSRLARSVRDTLDIADRLEKSQANLASLTERIDTSSALGKMVFRLLSTLNEFERDQLAERTESAMAHLRHQNRRISARIPFGSDLAADGVTLAPNAQEQATLTRMHTMRAGGASFAAIAQRLTAEGVPTKGGGPWFRATVRGILARQAKLAA